MKCKLVTALNLFVSLSASIVRYLHFKIIIVVVVDDVESKIRPYMRLKYKTIINCLCYYWITTFIKINYIYNRHPCDY